MFFMSGGIYSTHGKLLNTQNCKSTKFGYKRYIKYLKWADLFMHDPTFLIFKNVPHIFFLFLTELYRHFEKKNLCHHRISRVTLKRNGSLWKNKQKWVTMKKGSISLNKNRVKFIFAKRLANNGYKLKSRVINKKSRVTLKKYVIMKKVGSQI